MEIILATAFGCQVNILKGEGNSLTEAAAGVFSGTAIVGLSDLLCCMQMCIKLLIHCSLFSAQIPFSQKLFELFFSNGSKTTQNFATIRNFVMQVIEQRRQQSSENKVRNFVCYKKTITSTVTSYFRMLTFLNF